jgi:hypothetical protein
VVADASFTPTSDDEESDTAATLINNVEDAVDQSRQGQNLLDFFEYVDEAVYQYSQRQNVAPIDLTLERPLDLFAMSPSKRQRFR